jgi:predicted enzyme related to lactoylglutathione lyase
MGNLRSICGVILLSENPAQLAEFYGRVLGCTFEREDHGDLAGHFGVDVGEVHFGIHPPANFGRVAPGGASAAIAFNVDSLADAMKVLESLDAKQVQPPHDEGFGPVTSYLDPDGNQFELVELSYEFRKPGS